MGNILGSGGELVPGQSVTANSGRYTLAFQTDGNLVLYVQYRGVIALWDTETVGKPARVLAMQQADGNLVMYDNQQKPLWASGVVGHPKAFLAVQDDGNAVIYDATNNPIWATNTNGSDPLQGVSTTQNVMPTPTSGRRIPVPGVLGQNNGGDAIIGNSSAGRGIVGLSISQAGVVGDSQQFDGVFGVSHLPNRAGVSGRSLNPNGSVNKAGWAGFFDGNVIVTGDVLLPGAGDCAEDFDTGDVGTIEPGTVVVIDREGALRRSEEAYDKKVAGVISGAGGYRAGIVLDRRQCQDRRAPVALVGKVYCKVDARYSPVEIGHLLTSSPTPGFAMKADDPLRAFGAVIGKALRPLAAGQGLIPILVTRN